MVRSQVTGVSILPSFPQTLEGERILRETATENGPTVLPRQYFGVTAMFIFLLVYRFTKTYPDYPVVKASNFFHR